MICLVDVLADIGILGNDASGKADFVYWPPVSPDREGNVPSSSYMILSPEEKRYLVMDKAERRIPPRLAR